MKYEHIHSTVLKLDHSAACCIHPIDMTQKFSKSDLEKIERCVQSPRVN